MFIVQSLKFFKVPGKGVKMMMLAFAVLYRSGRVPVITMSFLELRLDLELEHLSVYRSDHKICQ